MPAAFIDSRSRVIPSRERLPSMKYQYTPGRAEAGGWTNLDQRSSASTVAGGRQKIAIETAQRLAASAREVWVAMDDAAYRIVSPSQARFLRADTCCSSVPCRRAKVPELDRLAVVAPVLLASQYDPPALLQYNPPTTPKDSQATRLKEVPRNRGD